MVRVPEGESPVLNPVRMTRVALPDEKSGKRSGGWVSFEVRKVVADWFRWPEDNLGLVVHAVHGDANAKSSTVPYIVNDPLEADGSLVRKDFLKIFSAQNSNGGIGGATGSVRGSSDDGRAEAPDEADDRPELRRDVVRDALLPLPADGGLCGVWLGLDHRPEKVRGQLLFRRVPVRLPAKVSAHAHRATGQSGGDGRPLLRPAQNVAHLDALL